MRRWPLPEAINAMSGPSSMLIKELVNPPPGTAVRRRGRGAPLLPRPFGTDDQREGMVAFVEKRPPVFRHS